VTAEPVGVKAVLELLDAVLALATIVIKGKDLASATGTVKPSGTGLSIQDFPARGYLIYYRKTRNGVDILHICHSSPRPGGRRLLPPSA